MELYVDQRVVFTTKDGVKKARISSIDGKLVKLLEEDGTYKQMPYRNLLEMIKEGFASIEKG